MRPRAGSLRPLAASPSVPRDGDGASAERRDATSLCALDRRNSSAATPGLELWNLDSCSSSGEPRRHAAHTCPSRLSIRRRLARRGGRRCEHVPSNSTRSDCDRESTRRRGSRASGTRPDEGATSGALPRHGVRGAEHSRRRPSCWPTALLHLTKGGARADVANLRRAIRMPPRLRMTHRCYAQVCGK